MKPQETYISGTDGAESEFLAKMLLWVLSPKIKLFKPITKSYTIRQYQAITNKLRSNMMMKKK